MDMWPTRSTVSHLSQVSLLIVVSRVASAVALRELIAVPKSSIPRDDKRCANPCPDKPGFLNRWGPEALFVWLAGGDVPGEKGGLYIPEGYKFDEVGPKIMKNRGLDETKAWEEKLMAERPAGCPFAFAR